MVSNGSVTAMDLTRDELVTRLWR